MGNSPNHVGNTGGRFRRRGQIAPADLVNLDCAGPGERDANLKPGDAVGGHDCSWSGRLVDTFNDNTVG
jgi:hypothetical protein